MQEVKLLEYSKKVEGLKMKYTKLKHARNSSYGLYTWASQDKLKSTVLLAT